MSTMIEQVARAIIVAGYNPATAENIARIAIEAMRNPTDAMIERAAEALREYELQPCMGVVKWGNLNEKIKQHYRGKVRVVVVDAVGI